MKQKILISIMIIFVVLSMNFLVLINSVKAVNIKQLEQADLQYRGNCGQLLKYKGVIVKVSYIEYIFNGKSYPAYCLDKPLIRSK